MHRRLALAATTALVLSASLAHADEITGVITQIDRTGHTFKIGDQVFAASDQNTVGPALEQLKEGDKVTVFYEESTEGAVSNATTITKED